MDFKQPGVWVWVHGMVRDENGVKIANDHARVADLVARMGLKWYALGVGQRSFNIDRKFLASLGGALRDRGVDLVTWHYGLDPRAVDRQSQVWNREVDQIVALQDLGIAGHILNFEVPWCFAGSEGWASQYCDALDARVTIPVAHGPMGAVEYHPSYPWSVFNSRLAATLPQLYATELARGAWSDLISKWEPMWQRRIASHPTEAPVCPIANTYGRDTVIPGAPNLVKVPGQFDGSAFAAQLSRSAQSPFAGWSVYTLECADPRAIRVLLDQAATAAPPAEEPPTLSEAKRADTAAKKAKAAGKA